MRFLRWLVKSKAGRTLLALLPPLVVLGWFYMPLEYYARFTVPQPTVPSPNGYDMFLQAYPKFSSRPDDPRIDRKDRPPRTAGDPAAPPSETRLWVEKNKAGFEAFAAALKAEFMVPPVRRVSTEEDATNGASLRQLARYKTAEGLARSEVGDHRGAVESALDTLEFGGKMPRGAGLIDALKGYAVSAIGRAALDQEIAFLTGPEAKAAATRLQEIDGQRVAFDVTMQEEKWAGIFTLQSKLNAAGEEARAPYGFWGKITNIGARLVSPRRLVSLYSENIDALTAQSKRPWPQYGAPQATSSWVQPLIEVNHGARFFHVRGEAADHLLLARLGLHAFRKEQGRYPASLQELVPQYLAAVPTDPFSGEPLHYRVEGSSYKLWSVGPDAKDDNAQPASSTDSTGKPNYLTRKGSTGDMVAGISR